mgnify:CR=1 FL=1
MQQIIFIFIAAVSFYFAFKQFNKIRRNILLGKENDNRRDKGVAWKNVALVAFGQKKMFKRWIPATLHLFVYVAFLLTQIELIEILIDGVTGKHRVLADPLGGFYTFIVSSIEVLSLLALVATFIFLWRRNILKLPRFHKSEMNGWPKLDGNIILYLEILLVISVFMMNGADTLLQNIDSAHYPDSGNLVISSWLGPALFGSMSESGLHAVERTGWWMHILTVFAFLNYLPYSKHLHIFLAFPNVFFAKQDSRGEMSNMPAIMNEVKSMMGLIPEEQVAPDAELPEFGAKDVFDLGWENIMQAYTCTECGRCTSVCPANMTGKKLSPRKIMMDIRDRAEEIGKNLDADSEKYTVDKYDDGKSLFDYISREELHACTTCNACVEACPVMIDPLEPILQLRRYEILTESAGPSDWVPMFTAIENSGAVWQVPDEREKWLKEFNAQQED